MYARSDPVSSTDPWGLQKAPPPHERDECDYNPNCITVTVDRCKVVTCGERPAGEQVGDRGQNPSSSPTDPYQQQPQLEGCPRSPGPYDPRRQPDNLPPGYRAEDMGGGRTNMFMRDGDGRLHFTPDAYYNARATHDRGMRSVSLVSWLIWVTGLGAIPFYGQIMSGTAASLGAGSDAPPVPPGCGGN
jgi:hypothetical protein